MNSLRVSPRSIRRRAGMTLVELMIASTIAVMMMGTFSYFMLITSRGSQQNLQFVRTQFEALNTLDSIRPLLMPARFSTISLGNEGRTVNFQDPWRVGITSSIEFDTTDGFVYFVRDIANPGAFEVALNSTLVSDVRFTTEQSSSMISVSVTTMATVQGEEFPFRADARFRVRSFDLPFTGTGSGSGSTGGTTGGETGGTTGGDTGGTTGGDTGGTTGGDTGGTTGGDTGGTTGGTTGNNGNGNGGGNGGIRAGKKR